MTESREGARDREGEEVAETVLLKKQFVPCFCVFFA